MTRRAEDSAAVTSCDVPALLLSRKQVGLALGGMSIATIDRLSNSGRLGPRPVRFGKLIRWRRDELEAWIRAGLPCREVWEKRRVG